MGVNFWYLNTQQHIEYTKLQIGRLNTAMEKLSFLLLSIAVLWIALTLATPSTAGQGETDLMMGQKTLHRDLRQARRNPKKNKNPGKGRNRKAKKGRKGKNRKAKKGRKGSGKV